MAAIWLSEADMMWAAWEFNVYLAMALSQVMRQNQTDCLQGL